MRRALLIAALASCHHAAVLAPRALTSVASLDARGVRSVVELDGNTYVFDAAGVTILRAGAVVARDELPGGGGSASTIAAPDGEGRWVMTALRRITPDGDTAMINEERLGLPGGSGSGNGGASLWSGVYGAGDTIVATSPTAFAVAGDGHHVSIFPATTASEIAVAHARVALAGAARLDVWDLAAGTSRSYPIAGAHVAFLAPDGAAARLVAWTSTRLAVEGGDGALHVIASPAPIAAAAAAGPRLWVWAGGALAYLDAGSRTLVPTALDVSHAAGIFGSPSGDVWVAGAGKLARYAAGGSASDAPAARPAAGTAAATAPTTPAGDDPAWTARVAPVFARVCAHCHLPDGSSGVDLSTATAWTDERKEIQKRVVVTRSMPPEGTAMSDADRATIAAWVGGH